MICPRANVLLSDLFGGAKLSNTTPPTPTWKHLQSQVEICVVRNLATQ